MRSRLKIVMFIVDVTTPGDHTMGDHYQLIAEYDMLDALPAGAQVGGTREITAAAMSTVTKAMQIMIADYRAGITDAPRLPGMEVTK